MLSFMLSLLSWILIGVAPVLAQGAPFEGLCTTDSEFKGTQHPRLGRLKGTVALPRPPCSAALVTFKGRSSASRALVLTAAHCANLGSLTVGSLTLPDDGEVLYRVGRDRFLTLDTGDSASPRTCVRSDQIIYATMTDLDIMLERLSETYEEIARRTGVTPFVVSSDETLPTNLPVRAPSSIFQNDRECVFETVVEKLKEHKWLWGPVMRLRHQEDCDIPHGLSGAAVLRLDTSEVVGVVGTAVDASAEPCSFNNPCEIDARDGSVRFAPKQQGYAHFVHKLYGCLDAGRDIDLETPGCLLPRPR